MKPEHKYVDGGYLEQNPGWHQEDCPWKAMQIINILNEFNIHPHSICDFGCGSGLVLKSLRKTYPLVRMVGYDISPQAAKLWNNIEHSECLSFQCGDLFALNKEQYDVLLMLDVFEHVRDPFTLLEQTRRHGRKFVFHIPIELNATSVLRRTSLLRSRQKVGHLHFYTKDLALETLTDCGYRIIGWRYTHAIKTAPIRSVMTWLTRLPRLLAYSLNKDWGVRLFGGETLIVLAE